MIWMYIQCAAFKGVRVRKRAVELAQIGPTDTVLDLGCSIGGMTRVVHDKGAFVTGMDTSDEMLSMARMRSPESWLGGARIRFEQRNVATDPLPPATAVTAAFLMHEMPSAARRATLRRVLSASHDTKLCVVDICPSVKVTSPVTGHEPFLRDYCAKFESELRIAALMNGKRRVRRVDLVEDACTVWIVR
jgi:ubiquinone/menaquinone biosynthesis C-methylase UbiE